MHMKETLQKTAGLEKKQPKKTAITKKAGHPASGLFNSAGGPSRLPPLQSLRVSGGDGALPTACSYRSIQLSRGKTSLLRQSQSAIRRGSSKGRKCW